jgi:hypothetical protein
VNGTLCNRKAATTMKNDHGWDGKLRVNHHPVITNPEAVEDPDYSDDDAPPVEEIEADEGIYIFLLRII